MRVAFRTDASQTIGTGHLMRCLTLADALQKQGAEVRFLMRHLAENLEPLVVGRGHELVRMDTPEEDGHTGHGDLLHAHWLGATQARDADLALDHLSGEPWDWLVVDHYALDHQWEIRMHQVANRILVIDDLADRGHTCDLLLDQNRPRESEVYHPLCPPRCPLLLGPGYALLRDEFPEARSITSPRRHTPQRVFVFYGGVDATNETAKALRCLSALGISWQVDVVIGSTNPHQDEIRKLVDALDQGVLHVGTTDMAKLMAQSDLSLGAAGTATWERASVGLPVLATVVADNQREIGQEIQRLELGLCLGNAAEVNETFIEKVLVELVQDPERLQRYSEAGWILVDGRGVTRVIQEMARLQETP